MKEVKFLILVLSLLTLYVQPIFAEEKINLKAGHIYAEENTKILIASSNVVIKYKDIKIKAQKIYLDTDKNILWGTGNIQVTRGQDTFNSNYISFNINKDLVKLKGINIAIQPPDNKNLLFVKADEIEDKGEEKTGKKGYFTTCDLESPHYYVYSENFEYYPNKRVIGYSTQFPILFLPINLWTPIYIYELGERGIVWNFPSIGEKKSEGWGWFVQNKIDYNNIDGKDSSVLIDWYENKGLGLGIQHQYELAKNKGEVYYYRLNEADTQRQNEKIKLGHELEINDISKLNFNYSRIDAERINSRGRQRNDAKSFNYNYDDLGDIYKFNFKETQDYNMNVKNLNNQISHSFNRQNLFSSNLNQRDNFVRGEKTIASNISTYLPLPANMSLTNKFKFDSQEKVSSGENPDTKLRTTSTLTQKVNKDMNISLSIDHLWDLDEERVTNDYTKNDFFYKMPELKVEYNNLNFGPFRFSEKVIMARYQEFKYNSLKDDRLATPIQEDFSLLPNTYIFKQRISTEFSGFSFETIYDQYIFDTPGKNIFEGDAMYHYKIKAGYSNTFFNCIKTTTSYDRSLTPDEGNSPFYAFDNVKNIKINQITEALTLFWENESKYNWSHGAGYNWVTGKWQNYNTSLLINPIKEFRFKASTGKNLEEYEMYPLSWEMEIAPSRNVKLLYKMTQDVNRGLISNTDFRLNFSLGDDPDYRWDITAFFLYNTRGQMLSLVAERYEMQELRITKYDHCRKMSISYNKRLDEIRFKYTINAFPDDPIGFTKNKELWKVEGVLDDPSAERF